MTTLSLGVVTLWTPEIQGWCLRHANDKASYCRDWGFGYYGYDDRIDHSRESTWSKIKALKANLLKHDWLLWLDADTVITNSGFDARDLCDDNFDMVVTHDHKGFNAGVFLIKNCAIAAEFLDRVWERNISVFHFEQTAMTQLKEEMSDLRVKVIPKRSMNSYWFDHRPGDFVFHAAGQSGGQKDMLMTIFANASRAAPREVAGRPSGEQSGSNRNPGDSGNPQGPRAVISSFIGDGKSRYLPLVGLWAEGVRKSGWEGPLILYTNFYLDLAASESALRWGLTVEPAEDPASPKEAYLFKAVAALRALETYEEILFTDVDVILHRNPDEWAFSYDRMMVSPDVFTLFHPCMLRQWYREEPDCGSFGANSGIWSVSRKSAGNSLIPWHREMRWRLETSQWPKLLNDQPQLNKLWYENQIQLGLFPVRAVSYPSTADWPGNGPEAWATHCCGVASSLVEMKKALGAAIP